MTAPTRKLRGLAVCAAIAVFLFARSISSGLDDADSTARAAELAAEEAKGAASDAANAASDAQDTADEANEKADRACNYAC